MSDSSQQRKSFSDNAKLVAKLLLGVVAMFGFGFALVPIYDVFCKVTGLNGKTGGRVAYEVGAADVDLARTVTLQFVTMNNISMNWVFHPLQNEIEIHPGELNEVKFYAKNPSSVRMVAQAVPSVAPSGSASFLHKTECFCFTRQVLEAGQEIEMPVRFFVDKALPKDVHKMTLSYTLFDVTENFVDAPKLSAN